MPVATESPARRISYDQLASFPKLFATYCRDYDALRDFYAGDFRSDEARRAAAERAAAHPRDRALLADVLLEQNTRWAAGSELDVATRTHVEALRDEGAVAVVTGQQVGLFTGPLYTLYKTLTTLRLAEQLHEETGRPVVPVFWLEGEDHDADEVARAHLLRRNERVDLYYDGTVAGGVNPGPVGQIQFTDVIEDVLAAVDDVLPPTDFKPALMERVRAAYRPGTTLLDAFARLLRALLPEAGLVLIDPSDPRLKAQAAPLFRREIEAPTASARRVEAAAERLEAEGFHAQVPPQPSNLFLLDDAGRLALDYEAGRFTARGTEQAYDREALLDLLDEAPECFSPNVVLRPLTQDLLLPTAAYVAGPGEVSYFGQYRDVYEWAELPMPIVYPRASLTLVEGKVQKVLDRFDLALPALEGDADRLFQQLVVEEMEADPEALIKEATRPMHEALNALKPQVEAVDGSLGGAVEAARAAVIQEMNALEGKVVRAEKRKQDEVRARLGKARVNLFPGETPQERILSPLYFLNKYSLNLPECLLEAIDLDTTAHQVVEL